MRRMEARIVRLEGISVPCLLVVQAGQSVPDEIEVEIRDIGRKLEFDRSGRVTWRLQPSSREADEPVYVEVFDE